MASLYGYPIDRFLPSSNLTDAHTYRSDPIDAELLEPYRCDVSYVSHGAATARELVNHLCAGSIAAFRTMMLRAVELIEARLGCAAALTTFELLEVMLRAEHETGHPPLPPEIRRSRVFPQVARVYDRVFRHQALEWAAEWARARGRSLRIYGVGWERHPTLHEFAFGEIASGEPLRRLHQASAVSLQVNGYASLHQRLLDGAAAGGFVLSRWNPADFQRAPFAEIRRMIIRRGCSNLRQCVELRRQAPEMDEACRDVERLTGVPIALSSEAARRRHISVSREANPIEEQMSDEGLFNILRDMRLVPARVAADLPGFERTTFASASQLHRLLDGMTTDADARQSISAEMRAEILRHDTYDSLVDRILRHFQELGRDRS